MTAGRAVAVIQARMTSTRLPGKALLPLAGVPMLLRIVDRAARIPGVDAVAVAAPVGSTHDPIASALTGRPQVQLIRGSEKDVLARTADAARRTGAEAVVRITSDCPMIDPAVSGALIAAWRLSGFDYARLAFECGYPLGFDTEVFRAGCLFEAEAEATDPYEREHATPFLWRHPERFSALYLDALPDRRSWRLVVDTAADYRLASTVYDRLGADFGYADLIALFAAHPELLQINAAAAQTPFEGVPRAQSS